MTPSFARVFRALSGEAVADAVRRRIVPVIAVVSLLSLVAVDGCSSCAPTVVQDGVAMPLPDFAGWSAMVIFAVLALWSIVLAGILASDQLAETLADGSAALVLARPVGRSTFALARLVGALGIALATAAILLGGSAALFQLRHGVAIGPALWAGAACALGAVTVAGLAMTASLFLPRLATILAVFAGVGVIAGVNSLGLAGMELTGVAWAIDRFGPPLGSAIVAALVPWVEPVAITAAPLELSVRSVAWAIAAVALLVVSFRRTDIAS